VHNLLAALRALRPDDEIVVFADADIVPDATWLSALVRPIITGETVASCGYRWQIPTTRNWPSLIVSAADMSIATAARSRRWNLCWGGSLALDRRALESLDLSRVWDRAASDDLTLTTALRVRGLRIYVPPRVLVPTPISHSWLSLFSFVRRQYLLARTYAPWHWWFAAWTLCVPISGAAVAIALLLDGHWWAIACIALSALLLQVRLSIRASIAAITLAEHDLAVSNETIKFARWAWPLIQLVHLAAFCASTFGRQFTWAGIRYRLAGKAVADIWRESQDAASMKTCEAEGNRRL
jgi:cellulose synthase/poly-beta-1,6-N-acetylglucosamine synthase-like glycosyltransferase